MAIWSVARILGCRLLLGDAFETWGWRIPFLLSTLLLGISVYIRLQLEESPVFVAMRREGTLSKAPLAEAFGHRENLRLVLLALIGATAGQAVVWYGGQFYALFFLEKVLQLDPQAVTIVMIVSLALATPFFVVFGALSDRVGRKTVVLAGCALAVLTYFPAFRALTHAANPALDAAVSVSPVTVIADPASCSFQFDPVGRKVFASPCDVAKAALARAGVPYQNEVVVPGEGAGVRIGTGAQAIVIDVTGDAAVVRATLRAALDAAGYPSRADMSRVDYPLLIALTTWLVILVTMVYGPIAAWLVELFPPRIRYSAMSLPYHIGNGWFGGFLPVTAFAIVAATGNIYAGLWYPVVVAGLTVVVGALFLPETAGKGRRSAAGV